MGRAFATTLLILSFGSMSPAAAADEPIVLKPSGNWLLDYSEERCRLGRIFGEESDKTIFWIDQLGPSSSFSWLLAGGAVAKLRSARHISAKFGPGFDYFEIVEDTLSTSTTNNVELKNFGDAIRGRGYKDVKSSRTDQLSINTISDPDHTHGLDPKDGALIDYVEFSRKDRRVRIATGNLEEAFIALNRCAVDLYKFWGLNPASIGTAVKGPTPLNRDEVANRIASNYPYEAERKGQGAKMTVKVLVNTDGSVEKCIMIKEVGTDDFDDRPCRTFEKYAKFEPAVDKDGNHIKSFYQTSIMYLLN